MWKQWITAIRATVVLSLLTGLLYPALVTGLARVLFPRQAGGSLITVNGKVAGSELIGQKFTRQEYFRGRPSAAGDGYDAANSGGSNLGPTSRKLIERVQADAAAFRRENPDFHGPIPADLLTASASGLDPHISPASAEAQAARVARARRAPEEQVRRLIAARTEGRQLGFLGEPRVNVLLLNMDLDRAWPANRPR
ncbi:MAG TPA: potassium-transporting ATPase subunit KdpC [Bryobacteraceae bacterium]|nr:potassium-transporting ATPase subunit KdpC [Bryobacteraceae bacterium]